jgi:hypothetical protein
MCQATGYKLKSNKELPCTFQVFSKLIPMTTHNASGDKPNANQLYPMYSVLEFGHRNNSINSINVKMCRVTGIFAKDGADSFTQTSYGSRPIGIEYLIEVSDSNVDSINETLPSDKQITKSNYMYGAWISDKQLVDNNKYLYIKY